MVRVLLNVRSLRATLVTSALAFGLCGCGSHYMVYEVVSDSMSPLIEPGDRILADQSLRARTNLHDGDVILLLRDDNVIIKRVLALPGETIYGERHKVYRNGVLLTENYLAPAAGDEMPELATFTKRTIPSQEVFVAGDNRDKSFDSRAESYTPVMFTDIVGQYKTTLWHAKDFRHANH